jgi:hypothetical protein
MSAGKAIFRALCDARDLEQALRELPAKDYARLYAYLLQSYQENGVSGHVLGMMLVEGARRYVGAMNWGAKFEKMKQVREVLG